MTKVIKILAVLVMLSTCFCTPKVNAQTLGDLKSELDSKKEEYRKNEEKKQLTESEIKQTNSDINSIKQSISQTYIDISNIEKEINNLYNQINEKKSEVKQIMNFLQVSNGESAYMEYIFGAESFTDLIYRSAVAEQLANYNTSLVDEYNGMIEESKKKQTEIQKKQVDLGNLQKDLETKVASLGQTLEEEKSTSLNIQDEIDAQKEIIEMYESKGCKDNENIATCGKSLLPPGTAFYRPTMTGYISSPWGTRYYMGRSWHEGIDVGIGEGTPVYAVATGVVATVLPRTSCGGNMVVVHHNINGKTYTSVYAHLLSIAVSKKETVNKNTIIGYSGGSSTKSYDACTGGAHLHLTVATGLYGVDYTDWSYQLNRVHSINPATVINFPNGVGRNYYWQDRITAF